MIREYKQYWIAFLCSALTGSIILALGSSTHTFPLFLEIIFGAVFIALITLLIGLVILVISWIFSGEFTLFRFIRISVTVSIVMTLIYIISFFLELRQR